MQYNVSQLLKDPIGATRVYELNEVFAEGEFIARRAQVKIQLMRTHQGVLAQGQAEVETPLTCSRCLTEFALRCVVPLEDEFYPLIDLATGRRLPLPEGVAPEDALLLDSSHVLDLQELLRQSILADLPLKPLCRPDCKGLCEECGANRNQQICSCATPADPRWGALSQWKNQ